MNLLLVDDEAGIREGLASFLRLKGYRVHTAASSCEARDRLESDAFDLVITDWRLAGGSPQTFLPLCDCPAIVMSGYPEEVVADGLSAVLSKPVSPHQLLEKIEALEAQPQTQTELPADTRDRVTPVLALLDHPEDVGPRGALLLSEGAFLHENVHLGSMVPVLVMLCSGDARSRAAQRCPANSLTRREPVARRGGPPRSWESSGSLPSPGTSRRTPPKSSG